MSDYWQDSGDAQQDGHNLLSLAEAQANFVELGASDLLWIGEVRPPLPDEIPESRTRQ